MDSSVIKIMFIMLTSFPSLLETNECTDSSSPVPFFTSISMASLGRRGREKGGTVRISPLKERWIEFLEELGYIISR